MIIWAHKLNLCKNLYFIKYESWSFHSSWFVIIFVEKGKVHSNWYVYIALNSYFRLTYAPHVTKYINQILKSKQKATIRADVDCGVILESTAGEVGKVNQADLHHVTTATGFVIPKVRC